jgi:hypothetical protein
MGKTGYLYQFFLVTVRFRDTAFYSHLLCGMRIEAHLAIFPSKGLLLF